MNPEQWDRYATRYGQDVAAQKLGPRPGGASPSSGMQSHERALLGELESSGTFQPNMQTARPRDVGHVSGLASHGLQGATFGFSDEMAGAVGGAASMLPGGRSPAEGYRTVRDNERETLDAYADEHPALAFGAQMVGGIGTGGVAGSMAKRALPGLTGRLAGRTVPRILAEGAAAGGVAGVGVSDAETLGGRLQSGMVGAGAGAMFAGALGMGGKAVSKGLDLTGMRPASRSTLTGRLAGGVVEGADDRANRKILEAMGRDDVGLDDLRRLSGADRPAVGGGRKPVSILDVGDAGGNVVGLGEAAANMPGSARSKLSTALTGRLRGESDRVMGDLEELTGLKREFTGDLSDDIVKRRSEQAAPLYEAAHDIAVKDPSGKLNRTLALPQFREAYTRAQRIAQLEGQTIPNLYDEAGKVIEGQTLPVRAIDYVKRGMDDSIDAGFRGGSMGKAEARAAKEQLRGMLQQVDELVPEYAQARSVYAGESAMLEALEEGRDTFMSAKANQISKDLTAMTDGEREMYRRGAIDAIGEWMDDRSAVGAGNSRLSNKAENVRGMERRLRALFVGEEDLADEFMTRLRTEGRMSQTASRSMGNSATARRLTGISDLLDEPMDLPSPTPRGVMAWTGRQAGKLLGPVREKTQRSMNEALGERLSAGMDRPGGIDPVISLLEEYQKRMAEKARTGSRLRGAGATAVGLSTGR